ncbi:MAG: 2-oxoglutarate dehydrogenase E1 component [Bacteroidetes bacterium]|nr:2-oxoglutarate dehydrogenase E1 component [Bacteroidota bacterium]
MDEFSYLNNADPSQIEELYNAFKKDPDSIDFGWRKFFEGFQFAKENYPLTKEQKLRTSSEFKVISLIDDYRKRGHLFTKTNPVRTRRKYSPTLAIENYGLAESNMNQYFLAGQEVGIGRATLKEIIDFLNQTYCQSIGIEYMYIRNTEICAWLKAKMEGCRNTPDFLKEDKLEILQMLTKAVDFEHFLHTKFPGQKRFSLEGSESLIPALEAIIEKGSEFGTKEFIIGMAHRGRLNVLANILKKSLKDIFNEFEGKEYEEESLLGDVKYHLGYTSIRETKKGKKILLTLCPNPSHLEAVNSVAEGIVRSRIDHIYNGDSNRITPVLIHGDASISGQGVVYEVIQMSGLEGYKTGGTIHLVINNQLGFTTNYLDGRTSIYCTDVAKTIQSPIFHVNADDVEALVYTVQLAMEFRKTFNKDVFIDLLGYRKYGHNEGDEPRFTQPVLYKIIENHPNPKDIYLNKLIAEGHSDISQDDLFAKKFQESMETSLIDSKNMKKSTITSFFEDTWQEFSKAKDEDFESSPVTAVDHSTLVSIGLKIAEIPPDKKFFRKTIKLQNDRRVMFEQSGLIDWAMAELLSFGTLLREGIPVRISGQDSQRGTFSQRHAVMTIEDSEEKYIPLDHLSEGQPGFSIYNSSLSEYGILGFEYGYALSSPKILTIWEAQFGDFSNGTQIIIDQYISSAEDKWSVMNGLVLLLPHGYEGQGPEHSSARLERFLSLCAENNLQVINCSIPANYFHALRRQMHRHFRKPLIIFTPKSLLRHPLCVSPLDAFTSGGFKELIDDSEANPDKINKVVFCSGKVFYDLFDEKEKSGNDTIALIRIEQIYPTPIKQIKALINKYLHASRLLWVQEEPVNMGAWPFIHQVFLSADINIKVIARPASGSPATGSINFHLLQQRKIISKTFDACDCHRLKLECKMVCIGNQWRAFEKEGAVIRQKKNKSK